MGLQVIGAGVGRTGTVSLKHALEQLLGGPCYHMWEVLKHPEHVPFWQDAISRKDTDWDDIYGDYLATVDWPGAAFWRPLSEAYPDALVLLSLRSSASDWFRSANGTINDLLLRKPKPKMKQWHRMVSDVLRTTFTPIPFRQADAEAAYERHNAEVRATIPPERLLEWQVTDGWEPICERLGVPVPDIPFPRMNTSDEFRTFLESRPEREPWLNRARRALRGANR